MINEPTPDAEATFRRRPLDCFPHATLPTRVPPFWPIVTLRTRKSELPEARGAVLGGRGGDD